MTDKRELLFVVGPGQRFGSKEPAVDKSGSASNSSSRPSLSNATNRPTATATRDDELTNILENQVNIQMETIQHNKQKLEMDVCIAESMKSQQESMDVTEKNLESISEDLDKGAVLFNRYRRQTIINALSLVVGSCVLVSSFYRAQKMPASVRFRMLQSCQVTLSMSNAFLLFTLFAAEPQKQYRWSVAVGIVVNAIASQIAVLL